MHSGISPRLRRMLACQKWAIWQRGSALSAALMAGRASSCFFAIASRMASAMCLAASRLFVPNWSRRSRCWPVPRVATARSSVRVTRMRCEVMEFTLRTRVRILVGTRYLHMDPHRDPVVVCWLWAAAPGDVIGPLGGGRNLDLHNIQFGLADGG